MAKRFDDTDGPTEFLMWVRETPPGRYLVKQVESSGTTKIINGVNFVGMVEIEQPYLEADAGSTASFNKLVHFYGVDGDMYHNRFIADPSNPQMSGWFTFKNQLVNLRMANGVYGDPGTGGLTMAAYQDRSGTANSKIVRGQQVKGSDLTPIGITASGNGITSLSAYISGFDRHTLPGTYVAVSGTPDVVSASGFVVALFMRIA